MREDVSIPALTAGFETWHPGGGAVVWRRNEADGSYFMLSHRYDSIDMDGDPAEPRWAISRNSDEPYGFIVVGMADEGVDGLTFAEALEAAELIPAVVEEQELDFGTIQDALSYGASSPTP